MTQFQCSAKLSKYLNKVEIETGRKIEFRPKTELGIASIPFAHQPDPSCIPILFKEGTDLGDPEHEHSIAHEATHGYLIHKLGYLSPREKRKPVGNEMNHVNLIFSMIEDIVVNKIIQKEGFPPFAPIYLTMLERETKAAREGSDRLYGEFSHDPLYKDRFMVYRYILARGFVNYCDLKPYARRTINRYLKWFKKSFVEQFKMANQIREVISQNDIFSAHGHRKTIEAVARLWHLDDLVGLQSI